MHRLILAVAVALPLAACGGSDDSASSGTVSSGAHDPCSLLSAGEAGTYVGPLASPPYRASDGAADTRGDECMYRGRDGRQISLRPEWEGGVLDEGAPGLDSMAHRVMKPEAGPWDKATWIPSGELFVSQGRAQVQVDVSGASGRESDALALARITMPRLKQPLDYDGAKAVALAPKAVSHPAHACDLVPRSAVEAAIGPLDGAPTSSAPETDCSWRVRSPQGERTYAVEFVWQGGGKNYRMLTHGMSTVGGPGSAAGAVATVGFKTDTALKGPCDNAALLHGTQLLAVRHDVFVGMALTSADYEKAKALLGAICSRL